MADDRQITGSHCGDNQGFKIQLPYWSKIKFSAARALSAGGVAGVGPFNYVVATGTTATAFSYGRGQAKTQAGFTAADGNAVDSDTNIAKGGETIAGESLKISGISVMPCPAGTDGAAGALAPDLRLQDDRLLAALFCFCSVKMRLNVRGILDFGPAMFMPGAGGLEGRAARLSSFTALAGDMEDQGFPRNGLPTRGNAFGLPDPIWWNDEGNDSLVFIDFIVNRNIVIWSGGDVDNNLPNVVRSNLPAAVATGTPGYTFPSVIMSELIVSLHGEVVGARSAVI